MNVKPSYVDKHGARDYSSRSIRAIDYARERGELPYYRCGRKVIFRITDLDTWMERFRVDVGDTDDECDKA